MAKKPQYLTSKEVRDVAERSDFWGLVLVAHCWAVVALAIALFALWPNPATFVIAVVLIGSRQLGFAILMHEASHRALFKTTWLNDFVGEWLCGRPILADLAAYRHYHLLHHRHTQTKDDPDLILSKPFPTTRASLRRKMTRDVTGQTGLKLRAKQIAFAFTKAGEDVPSASQDMSQAFNGPQLAKSVAVNLVLFAILTMIGQWWWWFGFWALPLLTWFQLVLRIRNIAEHGVVEFSDHPLKNVRTTLAGPLMRLIVAPYWVNYHLEHHLAMHVPCRNLPKLHELLVKKGHGDEMEIGRSYFDVLKIAASRPA